MENADYISVADAGRRLGIKYDAVIRMCEAGELRHLKLQRNKRARWRIHAAALEQFIREREFIPKKKVGRPPRHPSEAALF